MLRGCISPDTVRYGTVPYNIQGSWDIFILFTFCLRLTAVAGSCSQLASVYHRGPYPASDRPSRTYYPVICLL